VDEQIKTTGERPASNLLGALLSLGQLLVSCCSSVGSSQILIQSLKPARSLKAATSPRLDANRNRDRPRPHSYYAADKGFFANGVTEILDTPGLYQLQPTPGPGRPCPRSITLRCRWLKYPSHVQCPKIIAPIVKTTAPIQIQMAAFFSETFGVELMTRQSQRETGSRKNAWAGAPPRAGLGGGSPYSLAGMAASSR
jgi:hypothetical protein